MNDDATPGSGEMSPGKLQDTGKRLRDADERRTDRVEFFAALLIGIAAVLTAVATFQGGNIDGKIAEQHTSALGLTLVANDAYNDANAQRSYERDWFFGWITEVSNDTPAAEYLETAMPDSVFALAEEWYSADDDIADPFSDAGAEHYSESHAALLSSQLLERGNELDVEAACATFKAQVFEVQGQSFGLSTVFLVISLVVGGIAALLRSRPAQYIVLFIAVMSLVLGAGVLAFGTDEAEARLQVAPDFYSNVFDPPLSDVEAVEFSNLECPS